MYSPLETSDPNFQIIYRPIIPKYFVDRSTMISGSPRSGKSVMSMDILVNIRNEVPMFKAFIGTDGLSNSGSNEFLDKTLIKDTFTAEELQQIYDDLKSNTKLYNEINDMDTLKRIASYVDGYERGLYAIQQQNEEVKNTILNSGETELEIKKHLNNLKVKTVKTEKDFCKKIIFARRNQLKSQLENPNDKKIIEFINYSSRLLIYFDDVTSKLESLKSSKEGKSILLDIMTNIRHILGTTILALHDPGTLPTNVRTGMFNIIFTDQQSADRYFGLSSNGLCKNKDLMLKLKLANKAIFNGIADPTINPKKLWFVREELTFYYTIATPHTNPKPYLSRPIREAINNNIAKKNKKSALDRLTNNMKSKR